MYQQPWR